MENELETLIALVKRFEGCRLRAYYCPAGVLTCGWGSTGKGITLTTRWTQEQADARLEKDCKAIMASVGRVVPSVTGRALVVCGDFAYNLGVGALKASTFRRKLLEGDIPEAKKQLMRWVRGGGKVLPGLVKRRAAECLLLGG